MTILLDTHALHWWATEPERIGAAAADALTAEAELAVAAATWFELAWLVRTGRIATTIPLRTLIANLAHEVRTMPLTPSIAVAAAELPDPFPADPADRQIYATALEHGLRLVTRDRRMHDFDTDGRIVLW
ncbi:MAG TPA: type II toxin-antitoxin system VapC family toxin [Candidatus Limnocylindrales bacterium]|nr:type II toxin-antitoxin system VapC family toxin [Candidatus Limnocylindrales bacterium]